MKSCKNCGKPTKNKYFCCIACRNKVITIKGYKQSPEHISKRVRKGRKTLLSRPDSLERIAAAKRGDNNPAKRPEVRLKISNAAKGRTPWNKGKGKQYIISHEYKMIKLPDHPRSWKNGYVYEHIVILEKKIGRSLEPHEVTHHIDGNKLHNQPGNLMIMTHSEHSSFHHPKGFVVGAYKVG